MATLNVWGLWGTISRHLLPRMDAIATHAGELSLDVFAVQESWTQEGRDRLVAGLREVGLVHAWHNPDDAGGSGLVLFSRHPLRDARFQRFRLSGLPERLDHGDFYSGKGAVLVTLDTPAGPIDILDTHLVARYTPDSQDSYFGHRVGQVIEIAELLSHSERAVVALGDFNVLENGPEYPILTGLSGLVDAAVALDARVDTILAPHPYRELDQTERIDYVWTRDGTRVAARVEGLVRAFDERLSFGGEDAAYSDHAGLLAEIVLTRTAATRAWPGASESAFVLAREALDRGRSLAEARRSVLRGSAAASLVLAGACALGRPLTRRAWLRHSLLLGAGLASIGAGGAIGLAEVFGNHEFESLAELEAILEGLPRDA